MIRFLSIAENSVHFVHININFMKGSMKPSLLTLEQLNWKLSILFKLYSMITRLGEDASMSHLQLTSIINVYSTVFLFRLYLLVKSSMQQKGFLKIAYNYLGSRECRKLVVKLSNFMDLLA